MTDIKSMTLLVKMFSPKVPVMNSSKVRSDLPGNGAWTESGTNGVANENDNMGEETSSASISTAEVDCIILRPDDVARGIIYILSNGKSITEVFGADNDCDKAWTALETKLRGCGFIRFYNVFVNARRLLTLTKGHTSELGHHLHFKFAHSRGFIQQYADEQSLDTDYVRLINFLKATQDKRAGEASPTIH